MTNIYVEGILGKLFGKHFKIKVYSPHSALKAIDANRQGFMKKLFDLNSQGLAYQIIVDGEQINSKEELIQKKKEIKTVYIIPLIIGFGGAIVGWAFGSAFAATTAGIIVTAVVNAVISTAISLGVSFLMQALTKSATPPQQHIAIGGTVGTAQSAARSYIFANKGNVVAQGTPIAVGYGRVIVGTSVISAGMKSFSTSIKNYQEYNLFSLTAAFEDFTSN